MTSQFKLAQKTHFKNGIEGEERITESKHVEQTKWNIHELIPPIKNRQMLEEIICYQQEDKSIIMPIKFFECPYLLRPSLAWGDLNTNDIIRLCFTFPNERK